MTLQHKLKQPKVRWPFLPLKGQSFVEELMLGSKYEKMGKFRRPVLPQHGPVRGQRGSKATKTLSKTFDFFVVKTLLFMAKL